MKKKFNSTSFVFLVSEDYNMDNSNERTIHKEIAYQLKRIADELEYKREVK